MKKLFMYVFSFIFVLTLCACNMKNKEESNPTVYKDYFGNSVEIKESVNRIVSLTPNITELLYSLELGDKIVGRTDYCDYPEKVKDVQSIGTITEPSLEKIIELEPDIVLTDGMQTKELLDSIRNAGITVYIVRNNTSIEGTYQIIKDLGLLTHTDSKADILINNMKKDLEKLTNSIKDIKEKKNVYYSIDMGEYGLYTSGKDTYINSLIEASGLINIATDMEGWTYSIEKLIEHDPDYIIVSKNYGAKDFVLNYKPIRNLKAVKNKQIIEVEEDLFDRQTTRNIEAIEYLIETIYDIKVDLSYEK